MVERNRLCEKHKVLYVHWAKYAHTGRIAVNIGAAAFDEWVLTALEDPDKGVSRVTIRNVYDYVMDNYATILQAKVDANLDTFNDPIAASRTLAVYIRKQELFQEITKDTNVPITKATMVTTGTKHTVAASGMDDSWREWMRLPKYQKTWVGWKTIWGGAFLKKRELIRLTVIAYKVMANQAAETHMGNTIVVAIDNLVNAAVQKNNTVNWLVISNSPLSDSLAARDTKITRLLTIITNLSTGGGGGGGSGINNGKSASAPWDTMVYCLLHGFKVRVVHCSASCKKRKDGHNAHLTEKRGCIQGGCE